MNDMTTENRSALLAEKVLLLDQLDPDSSHYETDIDERFAIRTRILAINALLKD